MGGDLFVAHVAGDAVEDRLGDVLREEWVDEFNKMIGEIRPFDGAAELLAEVKRRGFRLVLASSGKAEHVETFLDLFGGKELADAWTTSDDAETSKPAPDIVQAALDRVNGTGGVMIGDSTWDCKAASKLHVPTLAVRTGGFSEQELTAAGAVGVYDSLIELRDDLDNTPLARAT